MKKKVVAKKAFDKEIWNLKNLKKNFSGKKVKLQFLNINNFIVFTNLRTFKFGFSNQTTNSSWLFYTL